MTDREMLEEILSKMNERFDEQDERFDRLETELNLFKEEVRSEFKEVKSDIAEIKDDMSNLKGELKTDIRNLELHLENVTDKGIKTVAEQYGDVVEKCDKALLSKEERDRVSAIEEPQEGKKVKSILELMMDF